MASVVYALGALTTLLCCVLLLRAHSRVRQKLLLWSGLCFAGLTVSNVLTFVDLAAVKEDLYLGRLSTAAAAMAILVFALIWEGE
jgi:hypothetical protein